MVVVVWRTIDGHGEVDVSAGAGGEFFSSIIIKI